MPAPFTARARRPRDDRRQHRRALLRAPLAAAPGVQGWTVRLDVDRARHARRRSIPRRSYSIASQSDAGEVLRFIIRVIPEGKASEFLMSLPIGTVLNMTGPHGFFVLDPTHPGDILFGATGTGISAVMPMLGELGRRREQRRRGAPLHRHVGGAGGGRPLRPRRDRGAGPARRRRAASLPHRPGRVLDRGSRADHGRAAWRASPSWSRPPSIWSATAP